MTEWRTLAGSITAAAERRTVGSAAGIISCRRRPYSCERCGSPGRRSAFCTSSAGSATCCTWTENHKRMSWPSTALAGARQVGGCPGWCLAGVAELTGRSGWGGSARHSAQAAGRASRLFATALYASLLMATPCSGLWHGAGSSGRLQDSPADRYDIVGAAAAITRRCRRQGCNAPPAAGGGGREVRRFPGRWVRWPPEVLAVGPWIPGVTMTEIKSDRHRKTRLAAGSRAGSGGSSPMAWRGSSAQPTT